MKNESLAPMSHLRPSGVTCAHGTALGLDGDMGFKGHGV